MQNSNLGQVSDWLTKLLLGAGLTQLGRLPDAFSELGDYLAPGLGGGDAAAPFAVVLVAMNLVVGFILGYLMTSLRLGAALHQADSVSQGISEAKRSIAQLPPSVTDDKLPPTETASLQPPKAERKEALQLYRRMLGLEAATTRPSFTAEDYRRVAQELVRGALYDEAVQLLESEFEQDPSDPRPLLFAGAIRGSYQGRYEDADAIYRRALAINPRFAAAYYNLACNAARQAHEDAVRQNLTRAFELDPTLRNFAENDEVWDENPDSSGQNYLDGYPKS